MIFRHPFTPLFQQRGSLYLLYVKNVDQCLNIETLKIINTQKGNEMEKNVSDFDKIQNMKFLWPKGFTYKIWVEFGTIFWFKKFLSPISLKFCVWNDKTIRISNFESHQNCFFDFLEVYSTLEDLQKYLTSNSNLWE